MSATGLHEDAIALSPGTVDLHRAYRSLMEELEAIDWYAQRIEASADAELKEVLRHNRDEEKEHAAMVLEWLRRRDSVLDRYLRAYLFSDGPIEDVEDALEGGESESGNGDLKIGSLRAPRSA
jgi:ferritin-like protein